MILYHGTFNIYANIGKIDKKQLYFKNHCTYRTHFELKRTGNHTFIYHFCRNNWSKTNSFQVIAKIMIDRI